MPIGEKANRKYSKDRYTILVSFKTPYELFTLSTECHSQICELFSSLPRFMNFEVPVFNESRSKLSLDRFVALQDLRSRNRLQNLACITLLPYLFPHAMQWRVGSKSHDLGNCTLAARHICTNTDVERHICCNFSISKSQPISPSHTIKS